MKSSSSVPITVNRNILEMEYAVRGPIAKRASELENLGKRIIPCHIGNPQALGQSPLTYNRQVLSLVEDPSKIARERVLKNLFEETPAIDLKDSDFISDDVLAVSENILMQIKAGGTGAYTDSKGERFIRQAVADFIDRRDGALQTDGLRADPEKIFLTSGASQGVKFVIDLLISQSSDGIMVPIPQYPLYSATIKKAGGVQVNYYPDEDNGWTFDQDLLEESLKKAEDAGVNVKGIVVINPGNPTGAILSLESIKTVIKFAREHRLAILADEVYQENVYTGEFISFARVLGAESVALFSFHSISKGFFGECGHRGGYLEVRNPQKIEGSNLDFVDLLTKQASVSLCANTAGQLLTYLMVTPPPDGSAARQQFDDERQRILRDLEDKATMIRDAFTRMDGVECSGKTGAMYLFPRLNKLPAGKTDFDYCMALLEETGLCTINGAGFGQKEGTSHLRIAFLPPKERLAQVLPEWIKFHNAYVG
ncbi:MAG: aminotransferase class I/II-fold pyridoxal phosphate-dependent enzyme [Chloroflexota bacterium]